jgi:hypothetical protein
VSHHANAASTRSPVSCLPKACAASGSQYGGDAKAKPVGDSPFGPFPGPSAGGVFPDLEAGAAASFAPPAVRVPLPGTRACNEQRGRSIQRPRPSHPRAWTARACSSLLADGQARDFAPDDGLELMDRRDSGDRTRAWSSPNSTHHPPEPLAPPASLSNQPDRAGNGSRLGRSQRAGRASTRRASTTQGEEI